MNINAMLGDLATPGAQTAMKALLVELGLCYKDDEVPDGFLEHLAVMLQALRIHMDRTEAYADHWVENGAIDNLSNARRKVVRQAKLMMDVSNTHARNHPYFHKDWLDDSYDGINYLVFAIRNARRLNLDGTEAEDV